jgi:acylpyruvate hydrolase
MTCLSDSIRFINRLQTHHNTLNMVRSIVCVARNYAAHARELGNAVPTKPFFFLKPASSIVFKGGKRPGQKDDGKLPRIALPRSMLAPGETHHEVELALVIGADLERGSLRSPDRSDSPEPKESHGDAGDAALINRCVSHVAVAIDATAREVQQKAKDKGQPWTLAKGIDTFCPLGPLIPLSGSPLEGPNALEMGELPPVSAENGGSAVTASDLSDVLLRLRVNGDVRQLGSTKLMLHPVPALLRAVTEFMTLRRGDLLLTGTPEGVGPLVDGDTVDIDLAVRARDGGSDGEVISHGDATYCVVPGAAASFAVEDVDLHAQSRL